MAYFPMFIDLTARPCLIVGGGAVAARKAEKLRPYGPDLRVIAPAFTAEFECCTLFSRPYSPGDEDGMALVIAATDDAALNRSISRACREKGIPVNVVDDKAYCTFLFPCLVQEGDLSIGISTGGASPTAAVWLKNRITQLVPPGFDEILAFLDSLRPQIKAKISDEQTRSALFARLFDVCMERGRPLTEAEWEEFL